MKSNVINFKVSNLETGRLSFSGFNREHIVYWRVNKTRSVDGYGMNSLNRSVTCCGRNAAFVRTVNVTVEYTFEIRFVFSDAVPIGSLDACSGPVQIGHLNVRTDNRPNATVKGTSTQTSGRLGARLGYGHGVSSGITPATTKRNTRRSLNTVRPRCNYSISPKSLCRP